MEKKEAVRYSFIFIFLVLLVLSFLIVKSYITAILASIIFAYMFYPIYNKISLKTNNVFAAIATVIIVILILILPLILVANILIKESILVYQSGIIAQVNELTSDFITKYISTDIASEEYFSKIIQYGINFLRTSSINFIVSLPSKILDFFIFIFSLFYLLIYGKAYTEKLKKFIPLKEKEHLINHAADNIYSIVYGTFLLALIEFIIASLGFLILGVKTPFVWGILVAFLVFIPMLGPAIVWIPFTLFKLVEGSLYSAIGILILGIILSVIDTFARAKILADKSKINPIVILLGVLGGLSLFGIIGIIVGPVILSLFIEILHIYSGKWNTK